MADLTLDLSIEEDGWAGTDWETVLTRALRAGLAEVGVEGAVEISALMTGDDRMRALKAAHLGVDAATNVLSFPAGDAPAPPGAPRFLGDLAFGFGVCATEAEAASKTLPDHIAHLSIHGALHLLGYDHLEDAAAERMEGFETAALARLDIADPYAAP